MKKELILKLIPYFINKKVFCLNTFFSMVSVKIITCINDIILPYNINKYIAHGKN